MKHIPLTSGDFAIVDDEDFDRVTLYRWAIRRKKNGKYAITTREINGSHIYMARLIMSAPPELLVDHISMDTLDNRKCNLRLATKAQNGMNRGKAKTNKSGLKGVHLERQTGRWRACVTASGVKMKFPRRETREEAHQDYIKAAKEMHGQFFRS